MKSLADKFVVLCGIIMGVWITYTCTMMLLISTRPELFREYEVYPGTYMLMGSCYTPKLTNETVEGFFLCLGKNPSEEDKRTFLAYIK
jgi:uncharacterized protein YneF (UPF0154 family)